MASKTTVCNQALSHLNSGLDIANIDTDMSKEAKACRLFYDDLLRETFRDFDWPFASETISLSLIEATPQGRYAYAYHYPSEIAALREIESGMQVDVRGSAVHYVVRRHLGQKAVLTQQRDARARVTYIVEDPDEWDADFMAAFTYLLAHRIAPKVTSGDAFKRGDEAIKLYSFMYSRARKNAANESGIYYDKSSGFTRDR